MLYLIWVQIKQIAPFWIIGIIAGSVLSTYGEKLLLNLAAKISNSSSFFIKLILASVIGAASPVTIYGMIPIIAVFAQMNTRHSVILSFITTSILINPNLFIYSLSLGIDIAALRLASCIVAGITAGLLSELLFNSKSLYDFKDIAEDCTKRSEDKGSIKAVLVSIKKAAIKTMPNLILGIILAAAFQVYFPMEMFNFIFRGNGALGVLFSASLGVLAYYCGGGTIPLIRAWLLEGISAGSAITFMITGPATKITNLTAIKTIMPWWSFALYLIYIVAFGIVSGFAIDIFY